MGLTFDHDKAWSPVRSTGLYRSTVDLQAHGGINKKYGVLYKYLKLSFPYSIFHNQDGVDSLTHSLSSSISAPIHGN
jgi:hypothetical protein